MWDPVEGLYRSFDRVIEKPLSFVLALSFVLPCVGFGLGLFLPGDLPHMLGLVALVLGNFVFLPSKILGIRKAEEYPRKGYPLVPRVIAFDAIVAGQFLFHIPFWLSLRWFLREGYVSSLGLVISMIGVGFLALGGWLLRNLRRRSATFCI